MKKRTVITTEEREVCIISEVTENDLQPFAVASRKASVVELKNTAFTLFSADQHKEIDLYVPGAGTLHLDVIWQVDAHMSLSEQPALITSLIEPNRSMVQLTLNSTSPIRMQQQMSSGQTGRSNRWIVRVQNSSHTKVDGRVRITYTPDR